MSFPRWWVIALPIIVFGCSKPSEKTSEAPAAPTPATIKQTAEDAALAEAAAKDGVSVEAERTARKLGPLPGSVVQRYDGALPEPKLETGTLSPFRVLDMQGNIYATGDDPAHQVTVFVFMGDDCPISAAYVPEVEALAKKYPKARFFEVLSGRFITRERITAFGKKYKISVPLVHDPSGTIAERLQPKITPEAFVLDWKNTVVYRGRIDDAYFNLGDKHDVQHHDVADAIDAVLANKPVATAQTEAIGCDFEPWRGLPKEVTYTRDIAPIIAANCASCHRPAGKAPFALLTYQQAAERSEMLSRVTEDRYMPPWGLVENFGRFRDEQRLSEREIKLFEAWSEGGAVEGNKKDLPKVKSAGKDGWMLGEPDLVYQMPKPFPIPASGADLHRMLTFYPTPATKKKLATMQPDYMVVGAQVRPGNMRLLHHGIFLFDAAHGVENLEKKDNVYGIPAMGDPLVVSRGLDIDGGARISNAYGTFKFVDGMGLPGNTGWNVVMSAHYRPTGRAESDLTSIGLYVTDKPQEKFVAWLTGRFWVTVPADAKNWRETATFTLPVDITLLGAQPHAHYIAKSIRGVAQLPSGEVKPIVWVSRWDPDWQAIYWLSEGMRLPKGTKMIFESYFDNSKDNERNPNKPPIMVRRGLQAKDEMFNCNIAVATDSMDDLRAIQALGTTITKETRAIDAVAREEDHVATRETELVDH